MLGRLMVVMERLLMGRAEMEKSEIVVLEVLHCFRVKLGSKGTAHPW